MYFPFDFNNVSLLLLVVSIVLLITTELIQSFEGLLTIYLMKERLANVAFVTGVLFLGTIVIRVYLMLLNNVQYPPNI
jgi:hypothetical protein